MYSIKHIRSTLPLYAVDVMFIIVTTILISVSCSNKGSGPDSEAVTGIVTNVLGCKMFGTQKAASFAPPNQSCIDYDYDCS